MQYAIFCSQTSTSSTFAPEAFAPSSTDCTSLKVALLEPLGLAQIPMIIIYITILETDPHVTTAFLKARQATRDIIEAKAARAKSDWLITKRLITKESS